MDVRYYRWLLGSFQLFHVIVAGWSEAGCNGGPGSGMDGSGFQYDSDLSPTIPANSRCRPREEFQDLVFATCLPYLNQTCHFFDYRGNYDVLSLRLSLLNPSLETTSVSPQCREAARAYVCNYVYPPCDPSTQEPVGICQEECRSYVLDVCSAVFESLEQVAEHVDDIIFERDCDNTLVYLDSFGFSFESQNATSCLSISGLLNETGAIPASPMATTPRPPSIVDDDGDIDVAVPMVISVVLSLIIILVVLVTLLYCLRRRYRKKYNRQRSNTRASNSYLLRFSLEEMSSNSNSEYSEIGADFQANQEDFNSFIATSHLDDNLLPISSLHITGSLGEGAFGRVYRGFLTNTSQPEEMVDVAIKTIKDCASYTELKAFLLESSVMRTFDHPHVLGLIGVCLNTSTQSPYLVLPFMANGDLRSFLRAKREVATKSTDTGYPEGLEYCLLVRMCYEIASGMDYLAAKKLVHRDLAARNCMVDGDVRVKVADFGLTRDIYSADYYRQNPRSRIPIKWMSPESLHDRISNEKTDVWSYGVACWEVFSIGRMPYPSVSNHEMLEYLEEGHRLKRPALCTTKMYRLMQQCWREAPGERLTFAEIVEKFHQEIIPQDGTAQTGDETVTSPRQALSQLLPEGSLLESIMSHLENATAAPPTPQSRDQLHTSKELLDPDYYTEMRTCDLSLSLDYYTEMNPIVATYDSIREGSDGVLEDNGDLVRATESDGGRDRTHRTYVNISSKDSTAAAASDGAGKDESTIYQNSSAF